MTENINAAAHGYTTGNGPYQLTTTGTLPAGLALATNYWIIVVSAGVIKLATSYDNAIAETAVDITDDGAGIHTIAGMPSTEQPSATLSDGSGAAYIPASVRRILPAPSSMTFRGYDAASVLTYYWV